MIVPKPRILAKPGGPAQGPVRAGRCGDLSVPGRGVVPAWDSARCLTSGRLLVKLAKLLGFYRARPTHVLLFRRKPATDTMSLSEQSVLDSLKQFADPNTGKDYVAARALKNLRVSGADVLRHRAGLPGKTQIDAIRAALIAQVKSVPGVGNVSANVHEDRPHAVQQGVKLLPG